MVESQGGLGKLRDRSILPSPSRKAGPSHDRPVALALVPRQCIYTQAQSISLYDVSMFCIMVANTAKERASTDDIDKAAVNCNECQ